LPIDRRVATTLRVVIAHKELRPSGERVPGSKENSVFNCQEVTVAIQSVKSIDESCNEMSSSVPGIGVLGCRLEVKAKRLTGHRLDVEVFL
jgi:hypothetical protein